MIAETVTFAALGIPSVARVSDGGPRWRAPRAGAPVTTHVTDDSVRVRVQLWIVARSGQGLVALAAQVAGAVCGAIEPLPGRRLKSVVMTVDGVGG